MRGLLPTTTSTRGTEVAVNVALVTLRERRSTMIWAVLVEDAAAKLLDVEILIGLY